MGVFKWLRRERVTVTSVIAEQPPVVQMGTIRTEEYKRDLAEFQARRSSASRDLPDTPVKRKCGRHSLPVSCADCAGDPDRTFEYEKKSAAKYKKNHRRTRSAQEDDAPNIQFLFQNQVFMPGDFKRAYSEPKARRKHHRSPEFLAQRHIEFDDNQPVSPPLFYKNNSLPFDVEQFLDGSREEVDGVASGDRTSPEEKNDGCEEKMWELSELKNFDRWADDQLGNQSPNTTKSDDTKSTASTFGLPIASSCNLDMTVDKSQGWTRGTWGVVPIHMKKLAGVTMEHVKKKMCMEINILRKCRHPNIILLMGLYPDTQNNIHVICERCVDTLFNLLHIEGRILSVQTSVQYALDVANALVFLSMHGYIHTELNSTSVAVTSHAAKLADLGACQRLNRKCDNKTFDMYSPEPQYVNLTQPLLNSADCEPLISARSSEAYLNGSVVKHYKQYSESELYKWQAPEVFVPDDEGFVRPCSKTDVYSLALILWECCNASMPWKSLSYADLKQEYTIFKAGVHLPQDGTYPGSLLALLRDALALDRHDRTDLTKLQQTLHNVKKNLDEMEYVILPERLSNRSQRYTNSTSPTDSECQSPKNIQHEAMVHKNLNTSVESDKESDCQNSVYIPQINCLTYVSGKCSISEDDEKYHDKNYSACSTPVGNMRMKQKYLETPCSVPKSDSTEYCSILSPDVRTNLALNDESFRDQTDRSTKLSRSFTPKSYKPLHIKVPEFNLDSIKGILKDQTNNEKSSYNFDIKNYSLPSTPIARSNKLRKNAWLSGDIDTKKMDTKPKITVLDTTVVKSPKEEAKPESEVSASKPLQTSRDQSRSTESLDTGRDSYTGLRRITDPPADFSPDPEPLERTRSLTCLKTPYVEDVLANVNVKPLVAIHERWIYEANRKTIRSVTSLHDQNRTQTRAVKPASHCVDSLPKSQTLVRRSSLKCLRPPPTNGNAWEQYNIAREAISKGLSFQASEAVKKMEKSTITDIQPNAQPKIDRATDTQGIEEYIKDLIRKEVQHLLNDMSDNTSESNSQRENELLNKRVHNIVDSLKNGQDIDIGQKDIPKSFSRIKINGNNKPLVQITFSKNGDNSIQVLDNCVNVNLSDINSCSRDKLNISLEDTLTGEDIHINGLKRCQAFSAIQEARSTEDLYIDDDLSTQMQENFGGKVKLIPLHGSLHEILCEKEDDCCLVKVKQENGCDTIYFRCDNSDTESRDAIDGQANDTVVYKRSISLIEERIQRVIPKDKSKDKRSLRRLSLDRLRARPKEVLRNIGESRARSSSSPALFKPDDVEVNIENVLSYQDSSSDECLRCQADDDFEVLEREIEEDLANASMTCGCLEKISEENLSVINEDY